MRVPAVCFVRPVLQVVSLFFLFLFVIFHNPSQHLRERNADADADISIRLLLGEPIGLTQR